MKRARYRRRLERAVDRLLGRGMTVSGLALLALIAGNTAVSSALTAKAERDLHSIHLLDTRLERLS